MASPEGLVGGMVSAVGPRGQALNRSVWFTFWINSKRQPISVDLPSDDPIPLNQALQLMIRELASLGSSGLSSLKFEVRVNRPTSQPHQKEAPADSLLGLLMDAAESGQLDLEGGSDDEGAALPDPEGLRIAMARQQERERMLNQKGKRP